MLKPKTSLTFDEGVHARIERLYKTYYDDMLRFARSRLRKSGMPNDGIDAEDAVQNVFLKMLKSVDRIRVISEPKLRAYLLAMVSHEVSDMVSRERQCADIGEYADFLEDEDFTEQLYIREACLAVSETVGRMDRKYGATLIAYFCYDMSVKELAREQGVSESAVYSRLSRGKKLLLKTIGETPYSV